MTGPLEPGGRVRRISRESMVYFPKSVPNYTHPQIHFAGFLPSKFFPHFASYRQTLATPTQFLTVILAQTARTFGEMSAVDV